MIRPATAADAAAMYGICLRTGDAGADATRLFTDPRLLGEVYVGPYLHCGPAIALVAEDAPGTPPLGYVVGTPDTARFAAACENGWWPRLRSSHPIDRNRHGEHGRHRRPVEQALVELVHAPPVTDPELVAAFPAHLHIDLLPRAQGRRFGRALMAKMLSSLSAGGARGVHVGVDPRNTAAVGFYQHLGFDEWRPPTAGATVLVLPLS